MEEIKVWLIKLPIKPVWIRLLAYYVLINGIQSISFQIFGVDSSTGIVAVNSIVGTYGIFLSESFGEDRFRRIIGVRNTKDETDVWLDLQEIARTGKADASAHAKKVLPQFIEESMRLRFRTRIYGPLVLVLGAVADFTIAARLDADGWIVSACVLLFFGLLTAIQNSRRIRMLRATQK